MLKCPTGEYEQQVYPTLTSICRGTSPPCGLEPDPRRRDNETSGADVGSTVRRPCLWPLWADCEQALLSSVHIRSGAVHASVLSYPRRRVVGLGIGPSAQSLWILAHGMRVRSAVRTMDVVLCDKIEELLLCFLIRQLSSYAAINLFSSAYLIRVL